MKASLKPLSFIFFIPFLLLISTSHSQAGEESSIQILIADDKEVIDVSIKEIKERILKGEPVHFVKDQEEDKRKIGSEWIIEALKKKDGGNVEKIDIENAIITGDLDFHIKENQVDIDNTPLSRRLQYELKDEGIEKAFLVSTSINIENCQLEDNLKAGYDDDDFKSFVIFEKSVSFDYSTVMKKASFSKVHFYGRAGFWIVTFNGGADFKNASFNDEAYYYSAIFNGEADFEETTFNGKAAFGRAAFNGKADFWSATFNGEANLEDVSFKEKVDFRRAAFNGKTDFRSVSFNGEADFEDASFKERAEFGITIFNDKVNFWKATFNGETDFRSASFNGEAYFLDTSFKEKAYFGSASFKGESHFRNASFKGRADFWSVTFNGETDFRSTSFNGEADFGKATFNGGVYFRNARLKEVIFNNARFSEIVDLRLTRYSELQISWSQLEGRLDDLSLQEDIDSWQGVYLRLIKNFKNIGYNKSADDAYYHYRYTKYVFCSSLWEKTKWWFGYLFMGLTCGYGVIPWRAIATAGGLIAIFTLCVYFPFSKQGSLEYQGKEDITKQEWYRRLYNCFYFSVIIFTTVGLGDIKPKGGFKAWATIEGILGWLTMALFLVTLANV
ncbi:hypothetical protein LCGC14_1853980, partial [marine sediment metagenome]